MTRESRQITINFIASVWDKHPTLRLGQLLESAVALEGGDIFYISDGKLTKAVAKFNRKTKAEKVEEDGFIY